MFRKHFMPSQPQLFWAVGGCVGSPKDDIRGHSRLHCPPTADSAPGGTGLYKHERSQHWNTVGVVPRGRVFVELSCLRLDSIGCRLLNISQRAQGQPSSSSAWTRPSATPFPACTNQPWPTWNRPPPTTTASTGGWPRPHRPWSPPAPSWRKCTPRWDVFSPSLSTGGVGC